MPDTWPEWATVSAAAAVAFILGVVVYIAVLRTRKTRGATGPANETANPNQPVATNPSLSSSRGGPSPNEVRHQELRAKLTSGEFPKIKRVGELRHVEIETATRSEIKNLTNDTDVLLVTVAQVEIDAALACLEPRQAGAKIVSGAIKEVGYWFGKIGQYKVTVVRCRPGSVGRDAAILTVQQAIENCKPFAVIAVGIAFGGYTTQLKMNDVLVSDRVIGYEIRRAGLSDQFRGPVPEAGSILLERFSTARNWSHRRSDGYFCKVKAGPLLSGET